jgi:hypothetical protein
VRVYRRATPWPIAVTPDQAGCRSWVTLEETLPTTGLEPALDEEAFARAIERIAKVVEKAPQPRF